MRRRGWCLGVAEHVEEERLIEDEEYWGQQEVLSLNSL